MKKSIIIDEATVSNIETLQYEVEGRKEIISQVLSSIIHINGSLFETYQRQYQEYYIACNKAKADMLKANGIPLTADWSLDFETRELTYEI